MTGARPTNAALPPALALEPSSRRPLRLARETIEAVDKWAMEDREARYARPAPGNPRASIVIVTFNNLTLTRLCLTSVLANTPVDCEVIIVDNGSSDGTQDYLSALEQHCPQVRAIRNTENRGFAAANNQALAQCNGSILVLLNNDTIVPSGWLEGLIEVLDDRTVGLAGPVTNRIGNEAEIQVDYRTYGAMEQFAAERRRQQEGRRLDIDTLCMFCLALRREVFERLGPLDERFAVGLLEDDDYSMRARLAGLRVVLAEDVFVHHFGGASFGSLVPTGEYGRLIQANRRRYEEKWGVPWRPYRRRLSAEYVGCVERIAAIVQDVIPEGSRMLVVSRGDDRLLDHRGRDAAHFPQHSDGAYAGSYPADSAEAIAHLGKLRAASAYLLFPCPAFWWLDYYEPFHEHLRSDGECVWMDGDCIIFRL